MSIGDVIWCKDEDDMIKTMIQLCKAGYDSDWDIEEAKNGNYILTVTEITEGKKMKWIDARIEKPRIISNELFSTEVLCRLVSGGEVVCVWNGENWFDIDTEEVFEASGVAYWFDYPAPPIYHSDVETEHHLVREPVYKSDGEKFVIVWEEIW